MRNRSRRWIWIVGAAAAVALLVWGFLPQPIAVDVATVARGRLQVTVDEDGFTRVKDRYVIAAPATGTLQRVESKPGDAIEAGRTVLAVIDPLEPALLDDRAESVAQARVKTSQAAVDQARASQAGVNVRVEHARTSLGRVQELFAKQMRSQDDLDRAQLELDAHSEELRAAESAVKVAEFQLEVDRAALLQTRKSDYRNADARRITLTAPIDGRVLRVLRESAGPVQSGEPLLEIADPTALELVADYLSTDAVRIAADAHALIEGWGSDRVLHGRVRVVEPSGFTKISALGVEEQRVNVIVDFSEPPAARAQLGDGFRVELRIIVYEREDAVKAPTGCLFPHGDGWAVFVAASGAARLRAVQIGQRNGLEAEVLGGLDVGERVILHPSDAVRDGVSVVAR